MSLRLQYDDLEWAPASLLVASDSVVAPVTSSSTSSVSQTLSSDGGSRIEPDIARPSEQSAAASVQRSKSERPRRQDSATSVRSRHGGVPATSSYELRVGNVNMVISLIKEWLRSQHHSPLVVVTGDILRSFMTDRLAGDAQLAVVRSPGEVSAMEDLANAFERNLALDGTRSDNSLALRATASSIWTKTIIWSGSDDPELLDDALRQQVRALLDFTCSMDAKDQLLQASRFWLGVSALCVESSSVASAVSSPCLSDADVCRIYEPAFAEHILSPPNLAAHRAALAGVKTAADVFQLDTSFSMTLGRSIRQIMGEEARKKPLDRVAWLRASEAATWALNWTTYHYSVVRPGLSAALRSPGGFVGPQAPSCAEISKRDAEYMRLTQTRHYGWSLLIHGELFDRIKTCSDVDEMSFLLEHMADASTALFRGIRGLVYEVKARIDTKDDVARSLPALHLQLVWPYVVRQLLERTEFDRHDVPETLRWMLDISKALSRTWPGVRVRHDRLKKAMADL